MRENEYQAYLKKKLKQLFPGAIILKANPNDIQGFPDLLILYGNEWAALECKQSERSAKRPNQEYYVNELSQMGFASFIYTENEEEVLDELQFAFRHQG